MGTPARERAATSGNTTTAWSAASSAMVTPRRSANGTLANRARASSRERVVIAADRSTSRYSGGAMTERVSFASDGLRLAGALHLPAGSPRRRPAFLVLHGFGSNKDSGGSVATATMLAELGYVALRFDMRGCGESEGPRGRVICLEQV